MNYVLAQRLELLEEVKRLQGSLGVSGDMSYTCETAGYFFLYQVSVHRMFPWCSHSLLQFSCVHGIMESEVLFTYLFLIRDQVL